MKGSRKIHIYGKQPVNEAVESGWPVFEIMVRGRVDDQFIKSILEKARLRGIGISVMEPGDFDSRYAKASQGVAARVGEVPFKELGQLLEEVPRHQDPLFVALDGIQDPQNLGSICRTSHAMGVHGLIVPRRRIAPFGEGAFKASSGAVFYQTISEVPNIHHFVQWCKRNGVWVYGLDAAAQKSLWEMDLTGPIALVVGSEGHGLSRLVRERCDFLAGIPMFGNIDSLNAGVACAMALYEVQRQRNFHQRLDM
ncbi:MAG TPA: 23S rRNA (guanosine(2251)-2'-O)-methyltransferase RlmB [Firmicutes bacterium]|nr:23S rRNA (guanosine(2251)-2'-O)-methyltransferase RlmB [Candidatus Fermentithermobacillaceae bacterium]